MRSINGEQAEFVRFCDRALHQIIVFPFIDARYEPGMTDERFVALFQQWFRYSKLNYSQDAFMAQVNRPMEATITRGSGGPLFRSLPQDLRDRVAAFSRLAPTPP